MSIMLFAKSRSKGLAVEPPTVSAHCKDVRNAAQAIWQSIGPDLAYSLGSDPEELHRSLLTIYLVAALLHDIGKANSTFQKMVQPGPGLPKQQPVRHELMSAIFISESKYLRDWLERALGTEDVWALAWSVAGHHLQVRRRRDTDAEDPLFRTANTEKYVKLFLRNDQIEEIMREIEEIFQADGRPSSPPPVLRDETLTTLEDQPESLEPAVRNFTRKSDREWKTMKANREFSQRLAMLKSLLISADVAGSALANNDAPSVTWIPKALSARVEPGDLDPIIYSGLKGRPSRGFQSRVEASEKSATIVTAGCGNGKTTAAYMWAQRWARGKKLFFTYPTTGTTSAGFEDYLLAQNQIARTLIHGRSWVDLQAMRVSPEDDGLDTSLKLESLTAWGQQVIACTVDTVLGLIQNQKRPLFSFPAIACGAFVFDEIHNYDRRLFGELLTFLQTFSGSPVLLMSASIPPNRLAALRDALGNRVGDVIRGDSDLEQVKRYRIEERESADLCWPDVLENIKSGKKVLWVRNTVGSALDDYQEALKRGIDPELIKVYHSRFLYKDRVERQDEVISMFKSKSKTGPCLAITTQVCEMSLDISADLLVTALCPLPALVQRLGRLNRYAEHDDPWPCLVYPFQGRPYDQKDQRQQMDDSKTAISSLAGKPLDQSMLAAFLDAMDSQEDWVESSTWLEGGWESESLPAREGDTSITVIREENLVDIEKEIGPESPRTWTSQRLVPWTIPILAKGFRWERRVGPYPLAPLGSVPYCKTTGAR